MARPKATPEQRAQVRRSIQRAATELYREQGLSSISARAVAKRAGVSVGTIYSYFGDLAGLGQSLWEGRVARQEAVFRDVARQHERPLARIEALVRAYLSFGIEQHELYRSALMFVRPDGLKKPDQQPVSEFAFPTLLKAAIVQGQAAGKVVDGDPDTLAQLLWSGVHGALALPVNLDRVALKPASELVQETAAGLMRTIQA